jgi:hypothetical protein
MKKVAAYFSEADINYRRLWFDWSEISRQLAITGVDLILLDNNEPYIWP